MIRLIFLILLFCASAFAEPRPCLDTLAAAKYPQELRHIPNSVAISGFANTFGDFFPVAKKELDRGRSFIRVQLSWRDDHNYGQADMKQIIKEAKRYNILCGTYPERIAISTFTEHNLNNPDKFHDQVKKAAPNCEVINNPWRGKFSTKYPNEIHGSDHKKPSGKYFFSYDGENSVDSNVEAVKAKFSDAAMLCMWHPRLNLKWSMKDTTPRPQRKAFPGRNLLESLVYLFTSKGQTSVPKNWLVKSHAEKHGPEDLKGDHLLLISPKKASEIVLKRAGKVIDKLRLYGSFAGGGWRYYSQNWGYKLGADLEVWLGGKKYGLINGGFRDGNYR